jgi:mannose-6-phosphate isomerase-like protein (cupin superfamily)
MSTPPSKTHFPLDTLEAQRHDSGKLYLEFVRTPDLSAGLYTLEADSTDPQGPHTEDELYVVLEGRAQINVDGEDYPANAGDSIFVPAHAPHRFHSILETLKIIVIFGPSEYSRRQP